MDAVVWGSDEPAFFTLIDGLLYESVVMKDGRTEHIGDRNGFLSLHRCIQRRPKTCRDCGEGFRVARRNGRNLIHFNAQPSDSGTWRIDKRGLAAPADMHYEGERWERHKCRGRLPGIRPDEGMTD